MVKKIAIGLSAILSGLTFTSFAFPSSSPATISIPCFNGGFNFGLAGLYLQPTTEALDYGLVFPGNAARAKTTSNTVIANNKSLDPRYAWGYSLNLGYEIPCTGNDVTVTYNSYDHGEQRNFNPGNQLFIATTTPFVFNSDEVSNFTAQNSVKYDYQTLDGDFGQHENLGCRSHLRLFAGVRFASLKNKFDSRLTGTDTTEIPNDNFSLSTHQISHFRGVGPRFGSHFDYAIGNAFGLSAEATGALLVGNFKNDFVQRDIVSAADGTLLGDDTLVINYPHRTKVVPNLSGKLGLNYNYQLCNATRTMLTLEAGYQVDHYFNAIDRSSVLETLAIGSRKTADVSFNGPYVALQVRL